MNRDEKSAFDAMLAEVDDSDSDAEPDSGSGAAYRGGGGGGRGPSRAASVGGRLTQPKPAPPRGGSTRWQDDNQDRFSTAADSKVVDEDAINNFGRDTLPEVVEAERAVAQRRWLMRAVAPEDGTLLCYVERSRPIISGLTGTTIYRMFLDDPEKHDSSKFFMAAKKKVGKGTSYYLVSAELDPDDRGSANVLGKVRANGVGSRYSFTDHGLAPEKTESTTFLRKELGVVDFEFDSGGPSKINAWLPRTTPSGSTQTWQPRVERESMETCIDNDRLTDRLIRLVNKKPKWDEAHGGHVLNFQGRVTEASVKNFQLCCANLEDSEGVVLQFGRVGKDRFTLDLKYPMSPFQAFCICVACMDGKIADRKGYEYMRKLVSSTPKSGTGGDSKVSYSADDDENSSSSSRKKSLTEAKVEGSISGSGHADVKQSTQYMKDKFTRTFKR